MQVIEEDRIKAFLEKKFRYSKSYATKQTYRLAVLKFAEFLRIKYNLDINQAVMQCENKVLDPIVVLDEFYTYLSHYTLRNGKIGYSNSTITTTIVAAKEFLNSQNLHIYNEDLKQRFRLPKKETVFEEGLTKEILVRLLHNLPPKLQTSILMCASSGMRIGELVQLKISDIDFDTTPTTIHIRKETTKTKESRFTCISAEATKSLKDYLRRRFEWSEGTKEDKYLYLPNDRDLSDPEQYDKSVRSAKNTLVESLELVIDSVPELSMKNENGRNRIHFHAFRAWFKTQVTDTHQSDFAEALMGHKSIKLTYYRQNAEARCKIYLEVEPALTISDYSKVEKSLKDISEKHKELEERFNNLEQYAKENGIYVPESLVKRK